MTKRSDVSYIRVLTVINMHIAQILVRNPVLTMYVIKIVIFLSDLGIAGQNGFIEVASEQGYNYAVKPVLLLRR